MIEPPLRLARATDAAEIARLLSPQGFPLTAADVGAVWEAWHAEGNWAIVIDGPDGLLGIVTLHRMTVLHRAQPVGRVTSVAVDPAAQGRGLGRTLMQAAEQALAQAGCCMLEVTSHVRRTKAHSFYEHLGYERTSYRFAQVFGSSSPPEGKT